MHHSKILWGPALDQERLQCPSDPVAGGEAARCPLAKYVLGPSRLALIIPKLYSMAPPMSIVTFYLSTYLIMLLKAKHLHVYH